MDTNDGGNQTSEGILCGVSFVNLANTAGAVLVSWWLVYLVFRSSGWGPAIGGFILLAMVFKLGVAPLFAIASSFVCFKFDAVGAWLPILSYTTATMGLFTDRIQRSQPTDP